MFKINYEGSVYECRLKEKGLKSWVNRCLKEMSVICKERRKAGDDSEPYVDFADLLKENQTPGQCELEFADEFEVSKFVEFFKSANLTTVLLGFDMPAIVTGGK